MLLLVFFVLGRFVLTGQDYFATSGARFLDLDVAVVIVFDQRLLDARFNAPQFADIARRDIADGHAGGAGATGAADAMNVLVGIAGDIVVEYMGDAFHVNAACGDIGGDEVGDAAFGEFAQNTVARALGQVAVQFFDG